MLARLLVAGALAGAVLAACTSGDTTSASSSAGDAAPAAEGAAPRHEAGASATTDASAGTGEDVGDGAYADAGRETDGDADAAPFATAAHEPWPVIQSQGGPVLADPTLVAIVPQNHAFASQLLAFASAMPQTQWWSAISGEYGLGTMSAVAYQGGAISGSIDESGLIAYVQAAIGHGAIPAPDGRSVYLLFVPSAAQIAGEPCLTFGGYHDTFPTAGGGGAGDTLALVVTCGDDPQDRSPLDHLTQVASHEVAEAVTDPLWSAHPAWLEKQPGQPAAGSPWWQFPSELGDMCTYTAELEQGFVFQRIWSVHAAAAGGDPCIPPSGSGFYGVTQRPGTPAWLPVQPGQTVHVPLAGWSTGPPTPGWWQLDTYVAASSTGMQDATSSVTSPKIGSFGSCGSQPIADNGGAASSPKLSITASGAAVSGDWAVVEIDSYRQDDAKTCGATRGTDLRRFWFVGVYVP
jgi:hypothetical protein